MRKLYFPLLLLLLTTLTFLGTAGFAQSPPHSDWSQPAYDLQNTNFSPQEAINNQNVSSLQIKWIYQVPVNPFNIPGAAPSLGIETTPLVISGIVYVATPYNRVIALNSATGGVVWSYQVNMTEFIDKPWWSRAFVISSLTYSNGTIYMMASDTSVYALNALTGQVEFVVPDVGKDIPGNTGFYFGEKAPLIYKNMLIVRPSTSDNGGRGFVAAYDLQTHKLLWRWYSVPPAGGDPNWDNQSSRGNTQAYPNDWGTTNLIGGGAAWGLMAIDNETGVLYFSTGHPSGFYDAFLRPGPNLYADSVIALNVTNGKMIWYYQINPHDITEHEGGWSITLAEIDVDGQPRKVVMQAAKSNYIYVLDAVTGKPVYEAIKIGPPSSNSPNDNAGANADMTVSQETMVGGRICPGPDGGVEMSPAYHSNTLFVVTQNACGLMYKGPVTYKGETIDGYIYTGDPTASQNSTLYAIDLSAGRVDWKFEMPHRYQGSSAVVSGGVVYVVDRGGVLYAVDEKSGKLLRSINLGGLGASGVSIARDLAGEMFVFVPAGGGDIPTPTPGLVLGLAPTSGAGGAQPTTGFPYSQELPSIILGALVVILSIYIVWMRGRSKK